MKSRRIIYASAAEDDFRTIYNWLKDRAGAAVASRYIERLQDWCEKLDIASERGTLRDDMLPGLRIIGFERRVTIAFVVEEDIVRILRLFTAGRNWEADLR